MCGSDLWCHNGAETTVVKVVPGLDTFLQKNQIVVDNDYWEVSFGFTPNQQLFFAG